MESSYSFRETNQKDSFDYISRIKMIELTETKEELRQAKDGTTQSWIRAGPLINKLEKLKSDITTTKSQNLISNTVMSELETELATTENCIKFQTETKSKLISKTTEMKQSMDQIRKEKEKLALENNKQRRLRAELKQALRLKKQRLETLQLMLRAIRLESEAIRASITGAVEHIYSSETDNAIVVVPHEEYNLLAKRAKEETLLADWRISISVEHRLIAEESRDSALRRLEEIERENNENKSDDMYSVTDSEEETSRIQAEFVLTDQEVDFTKDLPKLISWSSKESSLKLSRRIPVEKKRLARSKRFFQIKKPSLLVRIGSCLIQKVSTWFS